MNVPISGIPEEPFSSSTVSNPLAEAIDGITTQYSAAIRSLTDGITLDSGVQRMAQQVSDELAKRIAPTIDVAAWYGAIVPSVNEFFNVSVPPKAAAIASLEAIAPQFQEDLRRLAGDLSRTHRQLIDDLSDAEATVLAEQTSTVEAAVDRIAAAEGATISEAASRTLIEAVVRYRLALFIVAQLHVAGLLFASVAAGVDPDLVRILEQLERASDILAGLVCLGIAVDAASGSDDDA